MQQRVLLGAGVAVVAIAAFLFFRAGTNHITSQAVDKDIDRIIATLPPGYAATHGTTEANPLTGTVTLHDFKLSYGGQLLWSADSFSVSGGDQHALSDIFDPGAYPNGHPAWTQRRLLISDATADGVHIPAHGNAGGSVLIKSITLHQLSGRPFMLPPTRDNLRDHALQADIALAFAFESLDQHDLVAGEAPPKLSKAKLADVSIRDYDGGKLGAASLHDMSADIESARPGQSITHATLDSISLKHIDVVALLEQQRLHAKTSANKGILGTFDLAGLTIDISPGPRIAVKEIIETSSPADSSGVRDSTGGISGLAIALKDTPLSPSASAAIDAFGMNALAIDITGKGHYQEAGKRTDVSEDIHFQNLGTLHVTGDVIIGDPGDTQGDPRAALRAITLDHAAIAWQDAGLVDRSFNAAATMMHTTAGALRAELAVPLVTLGLMMPDQPDATDQISAFLNHPGTLTVTMDPQQKPTFADIAQAPAQEKAHLLGVHIQAK